MSLAQHVTEHQGFDRVEDEVGAANPQWLAHRPIRRELSYDAFPPLEREVTLKEDFGGVTPYNVSVYKRIAQIVTITVACWVASGIVFGFAALKPVFVREGVYREYCTQEELDNNVDLCYEQDLHLNFFFSLASTTTNVSALPVGTILDRFGPRVCYVTGCISLALGSMLMSYAFSIPEFDGYTIGNFFLALGGTFIFVPSFQIANAFPKYSGTIVAAITGAFDASAAVFLFYRLAYDASEGEFGPDDFFRWYTVVPVVILLAQLTYLPSEAYKTAPQLEHKIERAKDAATDVHSSDEELEHRERLRVISQRSVRRKRKLSKLDELLGDEEARREQTMKHEKKLAKSGVWGVLHSQTAAQQMMSPWFILIALLTVLQMVRMNYFISTIDSQYEYMLHSRTEAEKIMTFFDIALPVGGVACTPFLGLLLDNVSMDGILAIITVMITAIGIFGSLPYLWAGYINVTLFVMLRPLYYSAMSDYAAKVFGFATFGRVYGTIIALSGIVNFSQTGIVALTKYAFHDNPIPVNVFVATAGFVIGTAIAGFVAVQGRREKRRQEEEDANGENQSLMESVLEDESEYGTF
ncbi:hypothetical protein AAFC00_002802 [Neodothiora populina]|uniref:MFS transporter n=1 Tax=Neodothiora populina TaxID=2781224 RepID=A0ABR3P8A1_9PEZI